MPWPTKACCKTQAERRLALLRADWTRRDPA
jgi:hypothetical protein